MNDFFRVSSKNSVYFKINVAAVKFTDTELRFLKYRGGGEWNPTAGNAINRLQTLPSLRSPSIDITPVIPMRARQTYLEKLLKDDATRDIAFRVIDAIGFDELLTIRGLVGHVKVRLTGNWSTSPGFLKTETWFGKNAYVTA
ncbi:hypothetical protein JHW43_005331 [Diplocarpon mali]|nr:hypothetical protein JHW43_005331 [Diplocarpon mali]